MKKKLGYTFIIFTILLVITYIVRYKQALTFSNRIPQTATSIINIDARQLEHHILVDFLTHPITYLKSDTKKDSVKKQKFSLTKGVQIPKNVLFFTNNTTLSNAWFSSMFNVSDSEELSKYLIAKKFKKSSFENSTIYSKDYVVFVLKNKQLIIALKNDKKTDIVSTTQNIFDETDFLSEASALLEPIINSTSDICFTTQKNDILEANFKKGALEIEGKTNPDFDLFMTRMQPEYTRNSLAFISGKINKKHRLFQNGLKKMNPSKFKKFTHLSLDSIINQWNGSFSFNLKSITSKTDTIITYDYDDDFNKVEIKSTQKLIIPELEFELKSEKDSILYNYFLNKNAIQVIESDTLFVAFPLYKLYAHPIKNNVMISDKKGFHSMPVKESEFKLKGYFNIEEYLDNQVDVIHMPMDNKYIQLFKEASFQKSNKNKLYIKVYLKNTDRNFLGQFIKS